MTPSSIRQKVVVAKLATLRDMLAAVETLPLDSLESFIDDPRMVAAGESFLRRALEAWLDLGRHLLAKGFGLAVVEYKEIPRSLGEQGILSPELMESGLRMAGYRNRVVHFYDEISPLELYEVLTTHLNDLVQVVEAIEAWLRNHPEKLDEEL